jgi:hypothetical protein
MESRRLDEKLCEAEQHERCVRLSMWWVFQLMLMALAGLGYTTLLLQDARSETFDFLIKLFCRIGLGSVLGLAGFFVFWMIYRKALNRRLGECRDFVLCVLNVCWERSSAVIVPLPEKQLLE